MSCTDRDKTIAMIDSQHIFDPDQQHDQGESVGREENKGAWGSKPSGKF